MAIEHILDLARQVYPKTESSHIAELSGGFSSQAYKINRPGDPFVLLVQRAGAVSEANYGHAYVVLTLLQKHGFMHAPRPLWLHDDRQALAISFENGTPSDKFNFQRSPINTEQLAINIMDSLLDTAVITVDEYRQLATELGVAPLPVHTLQDGAHEYGTEWLEIVKESCPDQAIVEWLKPRVERSVKLAGQIDDNKPAFGHGDPSNPNILIRNDGSFMLIDWDSARFHTTSPEFQVAYTTHLTDFMKPHRQAIVAHVASRLHMPAGEFAQKVDEFRRYSEVFDVNWAAMMMAKVSSGAAAGDLGHFRKIALARIRTYEKSFEK